MKILMWIILCVSFLFSDTLIVKNFDVKVLINGDEHSLKVDQVLNLEEGSTICFLDGNGTVMINDKKILNKENNDCYQVPISDSFDLEKVTNLNNVKIIHSEDKDSSTRTVSTKSVNSENASTQDLKLNNTDKEVIIYDDKYGPLPVTLTIKKSDGTISKKLVNEDNVKTFFRIPTQYLEENSQLEITNAFDEIELKTKITKSTKKIIKTKKSKNKETKHAKVFDKKKDHILIEILYGTDRKKTFETDTKYPYENYYGGDRGDLKWGIAEVTIPKKHKFGEMERPRELLGWSEDEKKDKHVIVQSLKEIQLEEFSNILKAKLNYVEEKDIMLFIHGYNNTFADAIRRTAQLTFDLQFKGVPLTYSWPSQGNDEVLTYMQDESSVQYTTPHLVEFLSQIIDRRGDANIHIIGHSMGTRALTNALKEISYIYRNKKVFKNIILAAPDIDRDVFKVNLLPYIQKTTDMITLYSSSDDNALKVSKTLHNGERLGQSDNIFIYPGLNTIDATGIDTSALGHSYFAEKEILMNDLKDVIDKSLPPEKRSETLAQRMKNKLKYWKIKIKGL